MIRKVLSAALASIALTLGCDDGGQTSQPSTESMLRFQDAHAKSGIKWTHTFIDQETGTNYKLNPYDHGSGVLVADVNGDHHDDVLFLNFLGDNGLWLGQGDGTFKDGTEDSGLKLTQSITVGGCFGDYDNDGDSDLYLTTYRNGNHLFQNDGQGKFEDVTEKAGVGYVGHSNSATFLDYNLDGKLDLYLTNIGGFTEDTIAENANYYVGVALDFQAVAADTEVVTEGERNILWKNNGDGTFSDVTDDAGVPAPSWNGDCSVWDFDRDGDMDIYVANMFGPNNLYRNDGNGKFEDVASSALKKTTWGAIGCRFFDADNDGYADLMVADMHSDMWVNLDDEEMVSGIDPKAKYMTPFGPAAPGRSGREVTGKLDELKGTVLFGNSFFHNQKNGEFKEMSDAAGLETYWPWGVTIADFDRDGYQDVFLPAGMSYPYFYWPNSMMRNNGDLTFSDVATTSGLEPRPGGNTQDLEIKGIPFHKSSRSAAVLDMDQDGDLDLIVNNFNDVPYVYENVSATASWVAIKLIGGKGDTSLDAFGSEIQVRAGGMTQTRMIESATGYLCQSTATAYFGLGTAENIDKVTVRWAGGGEQDITASVTINKINRIEQK